MTINHLTTALAFGGFLAFSSSALAQTAATATTDLNLRSGPGPQYEVLGAIPSDGSATITGCLEDSKWCQVTYEGTEGWAYSDYLTADLSGERVVITERRADVGVPVATYDTSADGAVAGATGGAIAGAIVGGPIGAAVGGVAGAALGAAADVPEPAVTYVKSNPVDPIYLEGEVVVGATLPETVELREIPDYEYRYVYVNGVPVLVEAETRQIVRIIR
ncbi:DUF1236 domain-containing protein [Aurantimonas aggregata]|uniref:DUF1236 domain-containing protein n=1 Tax=Aurantimonas aggregata TaxID=2047720 RepID=A0A6L9MLP4_9HYPH|nr:DUF1236 domain-containing protein [Aurantimonas aggregata]NDV88824.1 DUF1236 domain-containing protein [Aurantimonas aggregata]